MPPSPVSPVSLWVHSISDTPCRLLPYNFSEATVASLPSYRIAHRPPTSDVYYIYIWTFFKESPPTETPFPKPARTRTPFLTFPNCPKQAEQPTGQSHRIRSVPQRSEKTNTSFWIFAGKSSFCHHRQGRRWYFFLFCTWQSYSPRQNMVKYSIILTVHGATGRKTPPVFSLKNRIIYFRIRHYLLLEIAFWIVMTANNMITIKNVRQKWGNG